jgi:hypothetical protein
MKLPGQYQVCNNRKLRQATLTTHIPTGGQSTKSYNRNFKQEQLSPSLTIYYGLIAFQLAPSAVKNFTYLKSIIYVSASVCSDDKGLSTNRFRPPLR